MFKKFIIQFFIIIAILLFITSIFILSHYNDTATQKSDCVVIFGAAVWSNNQPSHALLDRTMAGITLYKADLTNHCLVLSGGASQSKLLHEVDIMRKIALNEDVPETALTLDYNGINTRATIQNLDPTKTYTLVSNDFHLARIALFAHRANLITTTHASTYLHDRYIKEPQFFFREMVALWYYGLHFDIFAQ